MLRPVRRAWMVGFGVLAGCGAPPPAAKEPPAPGAAPAVVEAPVAAELAPAAEPQALLLVARWKHATKSVDETLKLLGVPIAIESLAAADADLGSVWKQIDLEASLDLAMSLDPESKDDEPKFFAAVSIPLRSFDDARGLAEKEGTHLASIRPGVLRMPPTPGHKGACELAATAGTGGPGPARMVCGDSARDLEALGDWLERGLSRTAPDTNDLVATLRARPLKDRYLPPLRTKAAELGEEARTALAAQSVNDPEVTAAPGVVLDEGLHFIEDIDTLELRSGVSATPPQLVTGGALRFAGRTSWLTHVLTDANDKAGPAPAIFWQAPRDASSATWGRGGDPRLYDGVNRVFRKALAIVLARAPIPAADKEAIEAFVSSVPHEPGAWVSAQGFLPGAKRPAPKATRTPAEAFADLQALVTSTLGWTIVGVEAPSAEYVAWVKQGVDVYARAVRLALELAASSKSKKDEVRELREFLPRITTVNAPPGWPKGTVAFDAHISFDSDLASIFLPHKSEEPAGKEASKKKKPPAAKGSMTLRLAIVPDGDRTWVGFSADLDALKKRMSATLSSAPKEGTLAARAGLSGLKEPAQTWGGFFSVGEIVERVSEEVVKEKPEHADTVRALLAALPNHGRTPILMVGSGTSGAAPSNAAEVRLQAGTLADLAGVASLLMSPQGKALLKKLDSL